MICKPITTRVICKVYQGETSHIMKPWICLFDVWNKSSKHIFLPNGGKKQKWWIFIPWENKSVKKHQQSPKNSLVGGFNPFEKYARQNGFIFPKVRGWTLKIFELPPPKNIDDQIDSRHDYLKPLVDRYEVKNGWGKNLPRENPPRRSSSRHEAHFLRKNIRGSWLHFPIKEWPEIMSNWGHNSYPL